MSTFSEVDEYDLSDINPFALGTSHIEHENYEEKVLWGNEDKTNVAPINERNEVKVKKRIVDIFENKQAYFAQQIGILCNYIKSVLEDNAKYVTFDVDGMRRDIQNTIITQYTNDIKIVRGQAGVRVLQPNVPSIQRNELSAFQLVYFDLERMINDLAKTHLMTYQKLTSDRITTIEQWHTHSKEYMPFIRDAAFHYNIEPYLDFRSIITSGAGSSCLLASIAQGLCPLFRYCDEGTRNAIIKTVRSRLLYFPCGLTDEDRVELMTGAFLQDRIIEDIAGLCGLFIMLITDQAARTHKRGNTGSLFVSQGTVIGNRKVNEFMCPRRVIFIYHNALHFETVKLVYREHVESKNEVVETYCITPDVYELINNRDVKARIRTCIMNARNEMRFEIYNEAFNRRNKDWGLNVEYS